MSTEMGWKMDSNPTDSGYTTQSDMNKMLDHLHDLAKENAGLAFMYVLYVIMPHSLDFQEGQLNREVTIQNDLTEMSNYMKDIQEQFNSANGGSESDADDIAGHIESDWEQIMDIANRPEFGSRSPVQIGKHSYVAMSDFASELYTTAGSFFQKYIVIYKERTAGTFKFDTQKDMGKDIYNAWHLANKEPSYDNKDNNNNNTSYSGDNGAAVKAFQDAFDNIDTTVSGQQGSVQSEMKFYQQVYQSMEAVEQNADKTVATVQRSANGGMKATTA